MAAVAGPSSRGGGGGGGGGGRGRGGAGGRGGGRGGGFGRGRGGMNGVPMGMLTWSDLAEVDKGKPNKHAFPPIEEEPVLQPPTERERAIVGHQHAFLHAQRQSPWWPVHGNELLIARNADGIAVQEAKHGATSTGATIATLKRGSAHLPRYSDKFRRLHENGTEGSAGSSTSHTILDTLQKDAFPVGLWRAYLQGETKRQERRQEAVAANKKRRYDWERIVQGVELTGGGLETASDGFPSDEEEDVHQDEYEDDVEDDYAENYFDNGEDDDIGDEGGGGGGEGEDVYE